MTSRRPRKSPRSTTHCAWTADALLSLGRAYQAAAVLAAAADLDLFDVLVGGDLPATAIARRLQCDPRGLVILLDALAAMRLLIKREDRYALPAKTAKFLSSDGSKSILAMAQHQANCLRKWAELAKVVKTGRPARPRPGLRGTTGDAEAFIGAMHNVSAPAANEVIRAVRPLRFRHLLDVGGASGTWTMAFLRACPSAMATLLDLPHVIPMARQRLGAAGLSRRVRLVACDFMVNPLPRGMDLAWVSAIVHQNSRAQNRLLFDKVFEALMPGGRIVIRDVLMDATRTQPVAGALFAVNMLVATLGGGTFTFEELQADLQTAGFLKARIARRDEAMNSVIVATKPH